MKYTLLFICLSYCCHGQTNDIKLTAISHPVQKDIYPQNYWNVWVNEVVRTEKTIKNIETIRRVRKMEYFNRFLVYLKMQTNHTEELMSAFWDSYNYSPHYTAHQYETVFPLNGKEYHYLWDAFGKEKLTIDSICRTLRSSYDLKLVKEIEAMKEKDQRYRRLIGNKTLAELKADGSWQKQKDLDKENSSKIKVILERIGYPGRSKVGYENESAVFLVIQHSNLELMEYGLQFVEKAIKNLDLDAKYFPYLYDRIQLVKKLPQLFGTQYNFDGTLYELSESETVNERRLKYGLHKIKI